MNPSMTMSSPTASSYAVTAYLHATRFVDTVVKRWEYFKHQ